MGAFEGYTSINYGDPDHQSKFETLMSLVPPSFTIKDVFALGRAVFPLMIQFVILALDYTLDAVDTSVKDEDKGNIAELYDEILTKQLLLL
jgi:hypothetical protein